MTGRFKSLWFRLIFGLVLGSSIAVLVAAGFLYIRFDNIGTESRERTLQGQARLLAQHFRESGGQEVLLPKAVRPYYRDGIGQYAVLSKNSALLAGSPGVTEGFQPIDPDAPREFFAHSQPAGEPSFHGISVRVSDVTPPIWVQVVFKDSEVIFDSVLEEFVSDIAWIWLPFVAMLLIINLVVIRIGLRPLNLASQQATAIGPAVSERLSETEMPTEVLSFVKAINQALDRLEAGYKAQNAFIADAAHELRTPIAIINTHLDVLPPFEGQEALKQELGALTRLTNQLLDNARLEAMQINPLEFVDLNKLAVDVVSFMAPAVFSADKLIEVSCIDEPVIVNGAYEYLFRAIRNLVENAIEHTPVKTQVSITIEKPATLRVIDCGSGVPQHQRQMIFQRFWQGKSDRCGGAGLGMAIVSRTIIGHGGMITIEDRIGGGAVFTLNFPALQAA